MTEKKMTTRRIEVEIADGSLHIIEVAEDTWYESLYRWARANHTTIKSYTVGLFSSDG